MFILSPLLPLPPGNTALRLWNEILGDFGGSLVALCSLFLPSRDFFPSSLLRSILPLHDGAENAARPLTPFVTVALVGEAGPTAPTPRHSQAEVYNYTADHSERVARSEARRRNVQAYRFG